MYFRYAWRHGITDSERKEGLPMIFRHFLAPNTGCASYVFG